MKQKREIFSVWDDMPRIAVINSGDSPDTQCWAFMKSIVLLYLALFSSVVHGESCAGIDRSLSEVQKKDWIISITQHINEQLSSLKAKQIQIIETDILQSFRVENWYVILVNTRVSDESFLFYQKSPSESERFVNVWSGAASSNEEQEINRWVRVNVRGIPVTLASCFSWYVTHGRNR